MNYIEKLGLQTESSNKAIDEKCLRLLINLKLAVSGQPGSQSRDNDDFFSIAQDLSTKQGNTPCPLILVFTGVSC
ncbi:MAG: hypothetical protein GY807_16630 [Gammaproteobacteria bacterium]|nr:hypothetical protein [Gammaproteobacteria bacterium]